MARAVNVMDIVDSRSVEVTAAMQALRTNMSVSYKLSIPFYMRRRAASHNPKRLPARVRPLDVQRSRAKFKWKKRTGKKQEEVKGEKIGEVEKIEEDKGEVSKEEDKGEVSKEEDKGEVSKGRRLETHVWHAKRCHMVDTWGYRLALCSTQKGERAVHRATNTATTVQDTSYYQWVSLSGDSLHSRLADVLVPNHFTVNRVTCSHLYHEGACLGPVLVMWLCDSTVYLRLHPAVTHHTDLDTVFTGLSYTTHCDTFSQFTLHGVRALQLLVSSLSLADTTNCAVREMWGELCGNPFYYDVMRGTVLGCTVVIPPPQHKHFVSVIDCEVVQPAHRLTPNSNLGGGLLFRSVLANTPSLSQPAHTAHKGYTEQTLPCCIYKDPVTGSLTVIIPRGTGSRVWISLIYNGGRVIGLQDAHSLNTDRSSATFPADYPDTAAGRSYLEQVGREKEDKEMRRPPQKRVKYEELGILSPFVSEWRAVSGTDNISVIRDPALLNKLGTLPPELDHHFITVSVSCVRRGNVRPGSHIFYLNQNRSRGQTSSRDLVYSSEDRYPLVGYVTSGKYCLTTGQGAGIALILTSVYRELGEGTLLVRNTTSKQYRHVDVSVVR